MRVKMIAGQSIADIAVQECGSAEYVFEIALLNEAVPAMAIDYVAERSIELVVPEVNNGVVDKIKQRG